MMRWPAVIALYALVLACGDDGAAKATSQVRQPAPPSTPAPVMGGSWRPAPGLVQVPL